ncbi:MAG: hypothetical protein JWP92_1130 [Caulobacter sp.]|nr:hypothetical protein [Caulobacter sp.]
MRRPIRLAAVTALAVVALTGCEKQLKAPFDQGVCMHVLKNKDGSLKFNVVARNVPNLETCAATLEGVRIRFVRLGAPNSNMIGSYQGSFLFLEKEGIYVGQTYDGARFMSLVRTGDGRLAVPGAIRQAQ